ncbi:hypothetical protein HPB49_001484 [Dermacentor silvarum]|uniref:Uncharacterized protein n=1 Tax=Dermacentor silvarum TaxID=543639 RepID=A0ACB8DSM7_DERSI|nr:hypothetical protein HPB49_001484 [Dermacentor silvarum]
MVTPSSTHSPSSQFEIIQWNSRGFGNRRKRSHLLLFLQSRGSLPSVLALQETGPNPTLSGYCSYIGGTTTSLLVHKSYTAVQVDLDLDLPYDYCMVSVLPQKRGAQSIHILNVYCPPHLQRVTFAELFYRALQAAARQPLVVVGDFNAPSPHWGYHYEKARGRKLKELISTLGFTLLTDPAHPTRLGNSVTRDTCPDLSLTRNIRHVTWENLEDTLDSDHFLLRIAFPTQKMRQIRGPARITDWSAFHTTPFPLLPSPQDYQAWASYALHTHQSYTRCICTSTSAPAVDPHLLHLWEARHSLTRRWRRYKLNRKLRSRIQALTAEAADYCAQLADTNWVDTCMKAAGQMSSKSTWRLFRSLLDPSTTRGETQRQLRRAYYAYQGPTSQLANDLCDRYLCRTVDPKGPQRLCDQGMGAISVDYLGPPIRGL